MAQEERESVHDVAGDRTDASALPQLARGGFGTDLRLPTCRPQGDNEFNWTQVSALAGGWFWSHDDT
jgi:hypothetical protein